MQLYAKGKNGAIVGALLAQKRVNYSCLECGEVVRRRGGYHRQVHFYHIKPKGACRQSGKGMAHLQAQLFLKRELPKGDVVLEHPFPTIDRIADVVWLSKQLVFEVQCSHISAEEVLARNADYAKVGYQVVWILHEKRFNRKRLSAAEGALRRESPFYFTDINQEGIGEIYDQLDLIRKGRRKKMLTHLPVDLRHPMPLGGTSLHRHEAIQARLERWSIYFEGDALDRLFKGEVNLPRDPADPTPPSPLWQAIKRLYSLFFQMLLEKCCK